MKLTISNQNKTFTPVLVAGLLITVFLILFTVLHKVLPDNPSNDQRVEEMRKALGVPTH
jgi:hypothetical protein